MNLLSVDKLEKNFGERILFENINFGIDKGDKIALIANNGTGKSSLLKIIAGQDIAYTGKVVYRNNCKVSYLPQESIFDDNVTINDKVQKCADFSWVMSHPFNMLGKLPVLSVPSGFSSSNVPTGIQLIARSYSDELVFQGGYNYEMLDPWLNSSKNRPSMGL